MGEIDRKVFHNISYGMYIVSSFKGDKYNGQIVNSLFQVTSKPSTIAISINKENLTHEYISGSGYFSVSILEQSTPMPFIGIFGFKSGRDFDKFASVKFEKGETGCPLIFDNTIGVMEAKLTGSLDVGTHTIFVGEVLNTRLFKEAVPLTYAYYQDNIKGKSPKNAPSYVGEKATEEKPVQVLSSGRPVENEPIKMERKQIMKKYVCDVCGYIYDPEAGDPDGGVEPGTPFEQIPDSWVCPVCGVHKDQFSPVD